MGNSQGRESDPAGSGRRRGSADASADRSRRFSRAELGFLGLTGSGRDRDRDRDDAPFVHRETRQEREARKLEKERQTRAKERERSTREEHVDGGYLVTLGTYTGTEDFSKPVVRQLQIERRVAPFWRGLNDWSDNWAEHQIVAAARGLPIPAADDPPDPDLMPRPLPRGESSNIQSLTVPMGDRTLSTASDRSASGIGAGTAPPGGTQTKSSPFKPRAKALAAALSGSSRNASSADLGPKEISLPHDPFVNGQALEVFLYKDATECPICFLTYPPYLNQTRCCDQPICSECFVQIKRADPHLPEHHPDGQARDPNEGLNPEDPPEMLISEPAACPYCQQPEFGVTYEPPPFRRGLAYTAGGAHASGNTAMSSQTSLHSSNPTSPGMTGRRRTKSLSATAPNVITTDRVRPDWATKLASARANQARRAAAATALHTAAFLTGESDRGSSLLRPGRFSRRNTGNNQNVAAASTSSTDIQSGPSNDAVESSGGGSGRRSRRNRMEELEDMMLMEAVRLSLASEEERKRKEEKTLRKEAKKREKEEEKAAKKAAKKDAKSPYGGSGSGASASHSSMSLSNFGRRRGNSTTSNLRVEATMQSAAQHPKDDVSPPAGDADEATAGKGKEVDRGLGPIDSEASASTSEASSPGALPIPTQSRQSSHLRQMSNASSIGSSLIDTPSGSYKEGQQEGSSERRDESDNENGTESMFNFQSISEMIGIDLDNGTVRSDNEAGGRPLSQVKEDEKEEAEAEHAEYVAHVDEAEHVNKDKKKKAEEGEGEGEGNGNGNGNGNGALAPPDVMVTPDTPTIAAADEGASESKQLGHSSVTEHASTISH